jgi:hypothetical protein
MASTEASEAQVSAEWDEARCGDALRHLELLQDQVHSHTSYGAQHALMDFTAR